MPFVKVTLTLMLFLLSVGTTHVPTDISGDLALWHRVTLTFDGPQTSEDAIPNPFLDYRMDVTFENGSTSYTVPGFFAADGDAANTSATAGNKWRVHFAPDQPGTWTYTVSFQTGPRIALSNEPGTQVIPLHGHTGTFEVGTVDRPAPDFRGKGRLNYVGEHYMQFADGDYFLKVGANSPENTLGYVDFDDTYDTGGIRRSDFVHEFTPHLRDWQPGDPKWGTDARGQELIGLVNYLSAQGVNSLYFITYNLDGGDGGEVWPWTSHLERERFDVSKLAQWEIVFSHMTATGVQLHVLLQENENDLDFGGSSDLNDVRKLYYRELIARFSHHPVLQWNLGEENNNTDAELRQFADYIRALDPYDHPIVLHSYFNAGTRFRDYDKPGADYYDTILQNDPTLLDGISLQGVSDNFNRFARDYRARSAAAGHPWVVYADEQGPPLVRGLPDMDFLRRNHIWGSLSGGAAGIEWYFQDDENGFGDLFTEDMRAADLVWEQSRIAKDFFLTYLPFWDMQPNNSLVLGDNDNTALAIPGTIYMLVLPDGSDGALLDLTTSPETFDVFWYDPRVGGDLQVGSVSQIAGPGLLPLGNPPYDPGLDWVVLVRLPQSSG